MSEAFKKFLKDANLSEDATSKLTDLYQKGNTNPSKIREIIVPELGNKIKLINEITNQINQGKTNNPKPLPSEIKLPTNQAKQASEDGLYTKILRADLIASKACKTGLPELNPGIEVIPEQVTNYLKSINTLLNDLENYEKNCGNRFNDEPTSILHKTYMKEHFKYGPILDTLVNNNKLAKNGINQSNAVLNTIESTIKILEDELKDFDNTEKHVKANELDILDIVHLRGFTSYTDLKKNEKKSLIEWTYRKIIFELPLIAGKLENYDPMLNHDLKLVKSRIQNLRSDVYFLEVNKDIIIKIDTSVNESLNKYRTVLDKVKQYEQ